MNTENEQKIQEAIAYLRSVGMTVEQITQEVCSPEADEDEATRPENRPIGMCRRCGSDVYMDGGFCGGCTP